MIARDVAARAVIALATMLALGGWRPPHPMHVSIAEVLVDGRAARMTMTVRVFATDLASALKVRGDAPDALAQRYVIDRVRISDERARPVSLTPCGVTRRGDLVWICTSARLGEGKTIEVTNRVLLELFDDQVNVLQVRNGDRRQSVLYRRGTETHRINIR